MRSALLLLGVSVALATAGCATAGANHTAAPSTTAVPSATAPSGNSATATVTPPPPPAAAGRTAIAGTTVTNRCAVEPDTGCPTVPVRTHVVLLNRAGVVMSTMDTDAAGRFRFNVAPGEYTVQATSVSGSMPRPGSVVVTVHADQVATVTIMMDSGIRCCQPPGPT